MSNTSGSALTGGAVSYDGDQTASDGGCKAPDLVGLLERITNQISDSERRQSEALAGMLARLDVLGSEARSYKSRVPDAFLPAFERIEDGVAMLAERIAAARDEMPAVDSTPQVFTEPAAAEPVAPPLRPSVAAEPAAAAGMDADAVFANDENAWDQASADALARHYENGIAGLMSTGVSANAPRAASPARSEPIPAPANDIERAWLEERFADIARRVEDSLANVTPDTTLNLFGDRFDRLEQRFGTALDGMATRTDVEGLGLLEAHIAELTQQFDEARGQLSRLDGIEQTLAAVVDRLTDPRFDEVLDRNGHADTDLEPLISSAVEQIASRLKVDGGAQAADIASLAEAAAERVASRFASANSGAADMGGTGDMVAVRQLLESFINERREGDEQTAAMLDTMQQAMIRVLDRVDAIEMSQTRAMPAPEFAREPVRFSADAPTAPALKPIDLGGSFTADTRPMPYEPRKSAPVASIEEDGERPFAAAIRSGEPKAAPSTPAPQPASASNKPAAPGSGESIERMRHDFIADARRAMQKASAAANVAEESEDGASARKPSAATEPEGATAQQRPRPKVVPVEPAAKSRLGLTRMPSRKVLVSALVLLVAIPGILMLAQKRAARNAEQPTAAKVEHSLEKSGHAADQPIDAKPVAQPTADVTSPPPADHGPASPSNAADTPSKEPEAFERDNQNAPANDRPGRDRRSGLDDTTTRTSAAASVERTALADIPMDGDIDRPPMGIHVAIPARAPTLEQLDRLQHRQSMAELSGRLGAAQQPAPLLASLIPEANTAEGARELAATGSAGGDRISELTRKPLELPIAAIGPLSLRMAAATGDPSAEFEVGARFAEANGVPQNFPEAVRWYQRSATQGFVQSQYRLATLFERGLGVKTDLGRAKIWYQRAAEGGNVKAMHNLAVLSAGRTAKTPDYATAATWFTAAAERGLADSQFNLAVLYEGGLGVAKDARTAYKWYAIAARSGDQEATRRRDEMERSLNATDLGAARALVANWRSTPTDRVANDPRAAGEAWKARASASET